MEAGALMARRSTGGVVVKPTSRGQSFGIRYCAGGRRVFQLVGNSAHGTTRDDAERELAFQLALIARGEWKPPVAGPERVQEIPSSTSSPRTGTSSWRGRTR
jgi:hypothetical protein